jgi:CheY-like chemotaxis protein
MTPPVADPILIAMTKPPKVLFVDDEPSILAGIRRLLLRQPYEVLVAGSAAEALALLEREDIAAVVTDQQMPGMCGLELLSRVRLRYPHVARIVLTGDPGNCRDHELGSAADRVLYKPTPSADLRQAIATVLTACS